MPERTADTDVDYHHTHAPPPGPRRPAVRPRDAATLVLMKEAAGRPAVLMGRRHGGHRFMPDTWVFPGGRVDPLDGHAPVARELRPQVARALERAATPHRARAIALAAVRETFEETGLMLAAPLPPGRRPRPGGRAARAWAPFLEAGLGPDLAPLEYLWRAVTPPYRRRRFNARFFVADGTRAEGTLGGSGELLSLEWIPIPEALGLELPRITRRVLETLEDYAARPEWYRARSRTPVFHTVRGRQVVDEE